jgi:hypothetical protein
MNPVLGVSERSFPINDTLPGIRWAAINRKWNEDDTSGVQDLNHSRNRMPMTAPIRAAEIVSRIQTTIHPL